MGACFRVQVMTPERVYIIVAETDTEKETWMNHLQAVTSFLEEQLRKN